MAEQKYEYGIDYVHDDMRDPDRPHREYGERWKALAFIGGWLEDGGAPNVFKVIRRPLGDWENYEDYSPDDLKDAVDKRNTERLGY